MARSLHVFACSRDSVEVFPKNNAVDFTVRLSKPIHLEGEWSCALVEVQLWGTPAEPVYVCCDAIAESPVGESNLPVLRRIRLKTTQISRVEYFPVKVRDFNTIRIYFKKTSNQVVQPQSGHTYCTLHFRRDA